MSDAGRPRHGRQTTHAHYLTLAALFACGGCAGNHAALNPAGQHARSITSLWWIFLITVGAVYVITMLCVLVPVIRAWRMRHVKPAPDELPDEARPQGDRRRTQVVWVAVLVTVVILPGLIVAD